MDRSIPTPEEIMGIYRNLAGTIFSKEDYAKEIPDDVLSREYELLKKTNDNEKFVLVINLKDMTFEQVHDVDKVLGYSNASFSMYDYLKIIHPLHAPVHFMTSTEMVPSLMRGDWNIEFMKQRLITLIALRHQNGTYYLFKRVGYVWQYTIEDGKTKLLSYVNEFILIDEFKDQPYGIRTAGEGSVPKEWLAEQLNRLKMIFENENFYAPQELRILREYANRKAVDASDIASILDITRNTVLTHNKRILQNTELLFGKKFDSARDVAEFLKSVNIL
jgi:hypothetical protein